MCPIYNKSDPLVAKTVIIFKIAQGKKLYTSQLCIRDVFLNCFKHFIKLLLRRRGKSVLKHIFCVLVNLNEIFFGAFDELADLFHILRSMKLLYHSGSEFVFCTASFYKGNTFYYLIKISVRTRNLFV